LPPAQQVQTTTTTTPAGPHGPAAFYSPFSYPNAAAAAHGPQPQPAYAVVPQGYGGGLLPTGPGLPLVDGGMTSAPHLPSQEAWNAHVTAWQSAVPQGNGAQPTAQVASTAAHPYVSATYPYPQVMYDTSMQHQPYPGRPPM